MQLGALERVEDQEIEGALEESRRADLRSMFPMTI